MRTPTRATARGATATANRALRELDRKASAQAADLSGAVSLAPKGIIGRARRITAPTQAFTTELPVLSLVTPLPLLGGRVYEVETGTLLLYGTATTGIIIAQTYLRYTVNGTTPTIASSAVLQQGNVNVDTASHGTNHALRQLVFPTVDSPGLGVLLTYFGPTGNGNIGMLASATYPITLTVTDLGPDPGDTGTSY